FGLDMSSHEEYQRQRPAMHHWIDFAQRFHGVKVFAPLESDILSPMPLYGFDKSGPMGRKIEVRRKELVGRVAECDATIKKAEYERAYLKGALDDIDYMQTIWSGEQVRAMPEPETVGKVVNFS